MPGVVLVGTLTVRIADAELPLDKVTEAGLTDGWGPLGETVDAKFTVPVKLLRLVSVRMEESEAPFEMVRTGGEVAME